VTPPFAKQVSPTQNSAAAVLYDVEARARILEAGDEKLAMAIQTRARPEGVEQNFLTA